MSSMVIEEYKDGDKTIIHKWVKGEGYVVEYVNPGLFSGVKKMSYNNQVNAHIAYKRYLKITKV